jgi:hypothetical protein
MGLDEQPMTQHHESASDPDDYKNRAVLGDQSERCRASHLSDWDCKLALDVTGWLTLNRDNALNQPYYVDADRFSDLLGDEQVQIDDRLRATALSYIERKVDFLSDMMQVAAYVMGQDLGRRRDGRTSQLYEIALLCAGAMAEHGEMTPLSSRGGQQAHPVRYTLSPVATMSHSRQ